MPYDDKVSFGSGPPAPLLVVDFSAAGSAPVTPAPEENSSGGSSYVREPDPRTLLQSTTKGSPSGTTDGRGNPVVSIMERSRRLVQARGLMIRAHLESLKDDFSDETVSLVTTLLGIIRLSPSDPTARYSSLAAEVEVGGVAQFPNFVDEVLSHEGFIDSIAGDRDDRLFRTIVPWAPSNDQILRSVFAPRVERTGAEPDLQEEVLKRRGRPVAPRARVLSLAVSRPVVSEATFVSDDDETGLTQEDLDVARGRMVLAQLHAIGNEPTDENQKMVRALLGLRRRLNRGGMSPDLEIQVALGKNKFGELVDSLVENTPLVLAAARDTRTFQALVPWAPQDLEEIAESPFADPEIDAQNENDILQTTLERLLVLAPEREGELRVWLEGWYRQTKYRLGTNAALDLAVNLGEVYRYQYRVGEVERETYDQIMGELRYPPVLHFLRRAADELSFFLQTRPTSRISYRDSAPAPSHGTTRDEGDLLPGTELPVVAGNLPEGRTDEEKASERDRSVLERVERDPKLIY